MPRPWVRAKLYCNRAEALWTMGADWRDPETPNKLLDLARDYDKIAEPETAAMANRYNRSVDSLWQDDMTPPCRSDNSGNHNRLGGA